jgi:Tol biopolymer transport system component
MSVRVFRPVPVAPLAAVVITVASLAGVASAQQPMARMSVDSNGVEGDSGGNAPALSADGRFVAFESASSNLVPGDTNGVSDIFVHDRVTGATVRVSVDSAGNEADRISSGATISGDGRFVAFSSWASKLVLHDTNGVYDIFVHDRDPDGNGVFDEGNGVTTRVSVDSNGTQGDGHSFNAAISADGTRVAFQSQSDDLVPGDRNGRWTSRADCITGTTVRAASTGGRRGRQLSSPRPSADGQVVASNPSRRTRRRRHERQRRRLHCDLSSGATTRV